jgi:hypothetical protein
MKPAQENSLCSQGEHGSMESCIAQELLRAAATRGLYLRCGVRWARSKSEMSNCFWFDLGDRASNAKKAARSARKVGMMRASMGGGSATERVQPKIGHNYEIIEAFLRLRLRKRNKHDTQRAREGANLR